MNALLFCERVILEARTGQVSLIGLFEGAASPAFPLVIPLVYVYARMTDAHGEYLFKLELVRRHDMSVLAEAVLDSARADDPMADKEAVFEFHGVALKRPGHYDCRLWANDTMFLNSTSFFAEQKPR